MALTRPTPYRRSTSPSLAGGELRFLMDQLQRLETTLGDLCALCPQEADAAPAAPRSGMQRLARAPWRPVAGQTADAWVYFDGPSSTWKLL